MDMLSIIRRPIEQDLVGYQTLFSGALRSDNALLQLALTHLSQRQGKRMRPMLTLLAARYAGGMSEDVLHTAVGLELLHTASLVHDDVVDESDRRRGQKSVNALMDNKRAVLVGDYLLSKAMMHATRSRSMEVMRRVALLGEELADGELLQLNLTEMADFSEEDYFRVIDKKTGSLFEACAYAGALLGSQLTGGSGDAVEVMSQFGKLVGRCFQLRDDIFDYDLENATGKPTGNDMREGKITLPLIYALTHGALEADRQTALAVRRGEAQEADMVRLTRLAHDLGGVDYAHRLMLRIADEAIACLSHVQAPAEVVEALTAYAHFVVGRSF